VDRLFFLFPVPFSETFLPARRVFLGFCQSMPLSFPSSCFFLDLIGFRCFFTLRLAVAAGFLFFYLFERTGGLSGRVISLSTLPRRSLFFWDQTDQLFFPPSPLSFPFFFFGLRLPPVITILGSVAPFLVSVSLWCPPFVLAALSLLSGGCRHPLWR